MQCDRLMLLVLISFLSFFFFQAEDGIRDLIVTGVQTCALPILPEGRPPEHVVLEALAMRGYQECVTLAFVDPALQQRLFPDRTGIALSNPIEIGRASCRERV